MAKDTTSTGVMLCESELALEPMLQGDAKCLCLITRVDGPSYRPLGTAMAVDATGQRFGNLSSGCIDEDVAFHAAQALKTGVAKVLRYGQGSPFMDLQLPCGGGLEIGLFPRVDRTVLERVQSRLQAREDAMLFIDADRGVVSDVIPTEGPDATLTLTVMPRIRVMVFGKGPEPRSFAALAHAADLEVTLFAGDTETGAGLNFAQTFFGTDWPDDVALDHRTAVTLFFHDHDRETALLAHALTSPAFFVGAQGSLRARMRREEGLRGRGIADDLIARLPVPFGTLERARTPRDLAAGVLAQVLDHARRV